MTKEYSEGPRPRSVFFKVATATATATATAVMGGLGLGILSASPAHADAANCSLGGDGFVGSICIDVEGSGTWVDEVQATFRPDPARLPDQTCDRTFEITYHPIGAGEAVTRSQYLDGCMLGYFWDWVTWEDVPQLADGSMLCVRTRNNQITTLDNWTVWECVEMRTHGGLGHWFEGAPGTGWF